MYNRAISHRLDDANTADNVRLFCGRNELDSNNRPLSGKRDDEIRLLTSPSESERKSVSSALAALRSGGDRALDLPPNGDSERVRLSDTLSGMLLQCGSCFDTVICL